MEKIEIRAISTRDVKIAQAGLEKIGFKTVSEGDAIDAYWVEMSAPEEYSGMKFEVDILDGLDSVGQQKKRKVVV